MRTIFLGTFIFIVWLLGCRYWYVCKLLNQCDQEIVVQDERDKTLQFVHDGEVILDGYDQFKFENNQFVPNLNDNNKEYISKVAQYLKDNPDAKLTVTGYYLPSEVDTTNNTKYGFFENIGAARADAIRKLLVEQGLDENDISIDYVKLPEGSSLNKPISFSATSATPDEFSNEGQKFTFTNMSFSDANFELGSAVFKPGPAFIAYADSVKVYLEQNEDMYLNLVGHTCDLGTDVFNMKLGKARANSVSNYFTSLEVKTRIDTNSEGENSPAYPNSDEANRSKNRRVVIQIKQ